MLHSIGEIDPSQSAAPNSTLATGTRDYQNTHLPLKGVCHTNSLFGRGLAVFFGIATVSLGFVIFVTSKQTLTGLKAVARCKEPTRRPTLARGGSADQQSEGPRDAWDNFKGKCALFVTFYFVTLFFVAFFAIVPFYHEEGTRETATWKAACDANDAAALQALGLL